MFEFLKRRKKKEDKITCPGGYDSQSASAIAAADSAQTSSENAAAKFTKSQNYTGSRNLYDSPSAKHHAKLSLFSSEATVRDPYTGEILTLTKSEAKRLYGSDWQKHSAEADHIYPLERIHVDHKSNPFLTNDDIRNAANSPENIEVTSRAFNNAKRSRTNSEFMAERDYRESKGITLSPEAERRASQRGKSAEDFVNRNLRWSSTARNITGTFHEAGTQGAYYAGGTALTMSGIMNITAVIKGEKSAGEAISDTVKDGGKGAVTGYAVSGGLTTLSQALSGSSDFVRDLMKSNVPGQVITAVMTLGGAVKRYAEGQTNTEEFMLEVGNKGAGLAGAGYGFAVGQSLIPIPVIGGAVGALAGSLLTGDLYNSLIGKLQSGRLEREERERVIAECEEAVRQEKAFRAELEAYLREWFRDCRTCFDDALSQMRFALANDDADGIIAAANKITRKLGGQVKYENTREFRAFLSDGTVDEF